MPESSSSAGSSPETKLPGALIAIAILIGSPFASAQIIDPSRLGEGTQSTPAVPTLQQESSLVQRSIEEENLFAPASDGDSDLGEQLILKETPKQRPFRAYANTFLFWTDNAANLSAAEEEDWFYGGTVGLGWQPRITNKLFFDLDVSQTATRYDRFDVLDYESLWAYGTLMYVEPRLWDILFFGGAAFNRITIDDFSEGVYNSTSLRLGVQKLFLINRLNSIHVSVLADWDVDTDLATLDRHEYTAAVGWKFKIMRDLIFSADYRYTYFTYNDIDRDDHLNFVGATLSWLPEEWLEIYLSASHSWNESSLSFFDYEAASVGVGIGAKVKF